MEQLLEHILQEIAPDQVEGLDLDARYLAELGLEPVDHFGGLEGFSVLKEFSVAGQHIDSWRGLPPLQTLEHLDLADNDLEGFAYAPPLPRLSYLDLSMNQIQNLEGIPEWPALRHLNLGHNLLQSLEGLEGRELESLVISGNKRLDDLSVLGSLKRLKRCYATNLLVKDWTWTAGLPLDKLVFRPTASERIADLAGQATLSDLTIQLHRCAGTVQMPDIPTLASLSLVKGTLVRELVLPEAPGLTELAITQCALHTVPDISVYPQLKTLDLRFNELDHLPDLSSLSRLRNVFLEGNPLGRDILTYIEQRPDIHWHL